MHLGRVNVASKVLSKRGNSQGKGFISWAIGGKITTYVHVEASSTIFD
jgi:hypothetical protein